MPQKFFMHHMMDPSYKNKKIEALAEKLAEDLAEEKRGTATYDKHGTRYVKNMTKEEAIALAYEKYINPTRERPALYAPEKMTSIRESISKSVLMANPKALSQNRRMEHIQEVAKLFSQDKIEKGFDMKKNFMEKIRDYSVANGLGKHQTGTQLINSAVALDSFQYEYIANKNSSTTIGALEKAVKSFNDSNTFMVFDTETLGGKNKHGQQVLDMITEFVAKSYDKETGKVIKEYNTVMGYNETMAKELLGIVDEMEKTGHITGRNRVIAERLWAQGHINSKLVFDPGGNVRYDSFADVSKANLSDFPTMRKGIERGIQVHKYQSQHMVDGMLPSERVILEAMNNMGQGPTLGYNINQFDIPMMNRAMHSQFGEEFRKRSGGRFNPAQPLDFMQVIRNMPEAEKRRLYEDNVEALKTITGKKLTMGRQEALAVLFGYGDASHHMASADVDTMAKIVMHRMGGDPNAPMFINHAFDTIDQNNRIVMDLKLGGNEVFVAQRSVGPNFGNKNLLSFVHDKHTGAMRTFSGHNIGETGVSEELFGQWGIKKDMNYTIEHIVRLEASDDLAREFAKSNPDKAVKDLAFAKIMPVFDPGAVPHGEAISRYQSPLYLVGEYSEVERTIQTDLIPWGKKGVGDQYEYIEGPVGDNIRQQIKQKNILVDEKTMVYRQDMPTPAQRITESSRRAVYDNASAVLRDHDRINTHKGYIDAIDYVTKEASSRSVSKDIILKEMHAATEEVSRDIAAGMAPKQDRIMQSLHRFLAHEKEGHIHLYPETIGRFFGSTEALEQTHHIRKEAAQAAANLASKTGSGNAGETFYFNTIMNKLNERVDVDRVTGKIGAFIDERQSNFYELDLSDYVGQKESTLRINLEKVDYGIGKKVQSLKGKSAGDATVEVRKLLQHLHETQGMALPSNLENQEFMLSHMRDELIKMRGQNPAAGYLTSFSAHDLAAGSNLSHFLPTAEDARKAISEIEKEMPVFRPVTRESAPGVAQEMAARLFPEIGADKYAHLGKSASERLATVSTIQQRDAAKYLNSILTSVTGAGMSISYDENFRNVYVSDGSSFLDISKYLPRMVEQNNVRTMQVGDTKLINPITVTAGEGGLRAQSFLGSVVDNHWKMEKLLKERAEKGEGLGLLKSYFRSVTGKMRQSPVADKSNLKAGKTTGLINLSRVFNDVYGMVEDGKFNDIQLSDEMAKITTPKELIGILMKGKDSRPFESLQPHERQIVVGSMREIISHGAATSDEFLQKIVPEISMSPKDTQLENMLFSYDSQYRPGEIYSSSKRGIFHQTAGLPFFRDDAAAAIRAKGLLGVEVGRTLDSSYGAAMDVQRIVGGGGRATDTSVTANVLSVKDRSLQNLILNADIKNETVRRRLMGFSTLESGAIGDPRLADAVFGKLETSVQKYKLKEVFDFADLANSVAKGETFNVADELTERRKMMPKIVVEANGDISFTYARGSSVNRGEKMIVVDQMGSPTQKSAVRDGHVKFGFFRAADGRLVDENIIKDTIAKRKQQGLLKGSNPQEIFNELLAIEEDGGKAFTGAFYLEAKDMPSNFKMAFDDTEKSMVDYAMMPMGSADDQLRKDIERLDRSALDRVLTEDEIEKLVKKADPAKRDALRESIYKERYQAWDELNRAARESGIIKDGEQIHYLTAHSDEGVKHGELMMPVNNLAAELKHKLQQEGRYSEEEMKRLLTPVYGDLRFDADSNRFITDGKELNLKAFDDLVKQENLGRYYTDPDGNVSGVLMRSHVTRLNDPTNAKRLMQSDVADEKMREFVGGLLFDDRGKKTMLLNMYDDTTMQKIRSQIGEETYREIYGHVIDESGHYTGKHGASISEPAVSFIDSQRFDRATEKRVMEDGRVIAKKLNETQLSSLNDLREMNIRNVTRGALDDYVSIKDSVRANQINIMARSGQVSELLDNRFREVNIMDLVTRGENMREGSVSIFDNTPLKIGLTTESLGREQLGFDHIVMPGYASKQIVEDDYVVNEAQEKIRSLQGAIRRYGENLEGDFSQKDRVEMITQIKKLHGEVNQSILNTATGKDSLMKNFIRKDMVDSGRYKIGMMNPWENNVKEVLGGLKFAGRNLSDFYEAGVKAPIDYTFMPKQFFKENLLSQSTLDLLGMDESQMVEKLRTEGVMGLSFRHPADYATSLSSTQMYLDTSLPQDVIKRSAVGSLGQKGDVDGDTIAMALTRTSANIQRMVGNKKETIRRDITMAEYELMIGEQGKKANILGVTLDEPDFFNSLRANMTHTARYNQRHYQKLLDEPTNIKKALNVLGSEEDGYKYATSALVKDMIATPEYKAPMEALASGFTKASKAYAGHINVPIDQIRSLAEMDKTLFATNDHRVAFFETTTALMEQYLSPKHETTQQSIEGIRKIHRLQEALTSAYGLEGRKDLRPLRELVSDLQVHKRKEVKDLVGMQDPLEVVDNFVNTIGKMENNADLKKAMKLANTTMVNERIVVDQGLESVSFANQLLGMALRTDKDMAKMIDDVTGQASRNAMAGKGAYNTALLSDGREWLVKEEAQRAAGRKALLQKTAEIFSNAAKNLEGKHLAIGAAGIASAVMLTSFVGGNPSEPPQIQAQNSYEEGLYDMPSLSDESVDMHGQSHQGYIINVNAQTRRGRRQAINAINEAMSQSYGTNVNISMNIKDTGGNIIGDRELEKLLRGAL